MRGPVAAPAATHVARVLALAGSTFAPVAPAFALAVCFAWAVPARADDVPMPGPVIDGSVTKEPAAPAAAGGAVATGAVAGRHEEPLWEFGLGVAAVRFPGYRGSDQSSAYVLPLPFVAYRGRFLRADRDGARAILFADHRIVVDMSLSASVPTRSRNSDARAGMPDLPGTFEIGPNVNVELWQSADRRFKLDLRLPVREAITLQSSPKSIGVTFSPNLNLDVHNVAGNWNLGMLAGPLYADRRYHEHFYGVAPEYATATRSAYDAPGGYAGWRATTAVSRRLGNAWLGGFVRYDDLHGAAFAPSPLVRRDNSVTVGFGVSWIFAVSGQRVLVDD